MKRVNESVSYRYSECLDLQDKIQKLEREISDLKSENKYLEEENYHARMDCITNTHFYRLLRDIERMINHEEDYKYYIDFKIKDNYKENE